MTQQVPLAVPRPTLSEDIVGWLEDFRDPRQGSPDDSLCGRKTNPGR
jgi:hypothetical protein